MKTKSEPRKKIKKIIEQMLTRARVNQYFRIADRDDMYRGVPGNGHLACRGYVCRLCGQGTGLTVLVCMPCHEAEGQARVWRILLEHLGSFHSINLRMG